MKTTKRTRTKTEKLADDANKALKKEGCTKIAAHEQADWHIDRPGLPMSESYVVVTVTREARREWEGDNPKPRRHHFDDRIAHKAAYTAWLKARRVFAAGKCRRGVAALRESGFIVDAVRHGTELRVRGKRAK